jgi:hypothetical protein
MIDVYAALHAMCKYTAMPVYVCIGVNWHVCIGVIRHIYYSRLQMCELACLYWCDVSLYAHVCMHFAHNDARTSECAGSLVIQYWSSG